MILNIAAAIIDNIKMTIHVLDLSNHEQILLAERIYYIVLVFICFGVKFCIHHSHEKCRKKVMCFTYLIYPHTD